MCRYNIAGTLVTGGRLVVYPELVRVFDVAREIGPSTLGLVPQLWAVLYVVHCCLRFAFRSKLRLSET